LAGSRRKALAFLARAQISIRNPTSDNPSCGIWKKSSARPAPDDGSVRPVPDDGSARPWLDDVSVRLSIVRLPLRVSVETATGVPRLPPRAGRCAVIASEARQRPAGKRAIAGGHCSASIAMTGLGSRIRAIWVATPVCNTRAASMQVARNNRAGLSGLPGSCGAALRFRGRRPRYASLPRYPCCAPGLPGAIQLRRYRRLRGTGATSLRSASGEASRPTSLDRRLSSVARVSGGAPFR
jgi:hypothetical protein